MRNIVLTVMLATAGMSTACTSAGADHRGAAPADAVHNMEQADSVAADTLVAVQKDSAKAVLTVAMTGDIMMGTTYPAVALPQEEGRALFKDAGDVLRNADLAVGNLEGTLCDGGETTKKKGANSYAFRTPTAFAPRLSEAGYDFLSMANNHAFDFGEAGVRSTEKALDGLGIGYAGLKGRKHAVIVERGGVRFGLCAFGHNSYTLRHQDLQLVKSVLDSLRQCADVIVVSFHGGAEGKDKSHLPQGKETFLGEDRGSLRDFARFCVDNGADIVYGHGPHVVRCMEVYKGRFIAYSLGNFCTPYGISTSGISGYAPVVEIKTDSDGQFLEGQIHPFIQKRGIGPRTDTTGEVVWQIRSLTAADIQPSAITIADDGKITLK